MARILRYILLIFAFAVIPCGLVSASDIDGHWAGEYFTELSEKGILSGDGAGNFMPERDITRAEFVCAAVRSIGEGYGNVSRTFSDVDDANFYAPYIYRAAELGIITGFSDGTFRPAASLTREEAIVILSRTCGFLSGYSLPEVYKDTSEVTAAAKSAFAYACRKGVISGYPDSTLRPRGRLSRAEAAVMLSRAMALEGGEPGFTVGYPRLAAAGIYGCIRVEICTNMPCTVYYTLYSSDSYGTPARSAVDRPLVMTAGGANQVTADIVCDVGSEYDVFLIAVTPDGRSSRIVKIEDTAAMPFTEGDGTEEHPYGIYNEMQLDAIRYAPSREFALKSDIELSGEWKPIDEFAGTLDGEGHKITALSISSDESYVGLFRRINKGKIRNLSVDGKVSGRSNAGIFAGEISGGDIIGCVASGSVSAETSNAGAFVGENAGKIENCLAAAYIVESSAFAGGVAGQNYGIIHETMSAVHTVSADMYAGGIASVNVGGRIDNSVAACFNVFDIMMNNCGRITTNKSGGITVSNYALSDMKTTAVKDVNNADNQNGANLSWETLLDLRALSAAAGWEEQKWSGGGRTQRYMLPYPKGASAPALIAGISAYAPIWISSAAELLGMIDNPSMHFLLVNNIYFDSNTVWETAADTTDPDSGFSGTLDGGGFTIYDLALTDGGSGLCGLFGMISGGTVRNLKLSNVRIIGGETSGAIAAVNFGTIVDCTVEAEASISSGESAYAGLVAGYNYGTIRNTEASGKITAGTRNITAGGIAAHNEGFIDGTAFRGGITTVRTETLGETVAGGICGYNTAEGMVYNSYASVLLRQQATTVYSGGICGILSGGELYKCSSDGVIVNEPPKLTDAIAYTGGIAGLCAEGLIMHAFSDADVSVYTTRSFAGGICGYIETAAVQNVYATSSVMQTADKVVGEKMTAYAGGICGYNEGGSVSGAAAINKTISSMVNTGRICAGGESEHLYGNYASSDMHIADAGEEAFAGTPVSAARFEETGFFTRPLAEGGLMGWSEEVWCRSKLSRYPLPVLNGVKYQNTF